CIVFWDEAHGYEAQCTGCGLHWQEKPVLRLYDYRVLANDSDGDPLDHGVVRAESQESAKRLVAERLLGDLEWIFDVAGVSQLMVRLYQGEDLATSQVLKSAGFEDFEVERPDHEADDSDASTTRLP